ncbi:hypothetical protein HBB16_14120 [Pseudonocardia sp. MCCB 268]|nr:hypothetical protein [Pseudonocardia cytotoxica]
MCALTGHIAGGPPAGAYQPKGRLDPAARVVPRQEPPHLTRAARELDGGHGVARRWRTSSLAFQSRAQILGRWGELPGRRRSLGNTAALMIFGGTRQERT